MKCPFKTPAKYEMKITNTEYVVVDAERKVIAKCNYEDDALFIQQAINSYELYKKLVAMLEQYQTNEFWNENPKIAIEAMCEALKETGEPQ